MFPTLRYTQPFKYVGGDFFFISSVSYYLGKIAYLYLFNRSQCLWGTERWRKREKEIERQTHPPYVNFVIYSFADVIDPILFSCSTNKIKEKIRRNGGKFLWIRYITKPSQASSLKISISATILFFHPCFGYGFYVEVFKKCTIMVVLLLNRSGECVLSFITNQTITNIRSLDFGRTGWLSFDSERIFRTFLHPGLYKIHRRDRK